LKLVLASTSAYRRALLDRLGIPFSVAQPNVNEAALPGEVPAALALRLAEAKARAVASENPCSLIIGSDQIALLDAEILGKPGNHANALVQLRKVSGRTVSFLTAVCVYDSEKERHSSRLVKYEVKFRNLDEAMIEAYLSRDRPYDCAGSAKAEALGIALIERMQGDDPNALIGLPLIALIDLLHEHGVRVI